MQAEVAAQAAAHGQHAQLVADAFADFSELIAELSRPMKAALGHRDRYSSRGQDAEERLQRWGGDDC